MICKTLHKGQWHSAPLNNLIDKLYVEGLKPKLSNLDAAERVITVSDNGELLGFVAIYLNKSYSQHLILGNFECQNNPEIAQLLFAEAKKLAKQANCTSLLGPMNGNTWHTYRYSTLDNDPFVMETIHQPYYLDLWHQYGFESFANYQTNIEKLNPKIQLAEVKEFLATRNLSIRNFSMSNAPTELNLLHSFCSELFTNNVLFSNISLKKFVALYEPILPLLDENLIDFVLDGDQVVGLLFAVKNHYDPKQVIVKTLARNPLEKYKGLANVMASHFYKKALNLGYQSMLHAYFHVDNQSSNVSSNYGGKVYQKHVLLKLDL
ncbi:MAG: hypothetical protein COA58_09590 [Bacteroidetes bacterium]|nr:MAG: hypothetical protein COA58_09590 [Bacteroidota bacterium]